MDSRSALLLSRYTETKHVRRNVSQNIHIQEPEWMKHPPRLSERQVQPGQVHQRAWPVLNVFIVSAEKQELKHLIGLSWSLNLLSVLLYFYEKL